MSDNVREDVEARLRHLFYWDPSGGTGAPAETRSGQRQTCYPNPPLGGAETPDQTDLQGDGHLTGEEVLLKKKNKDEGETRHTENAEEPEEPTAEVADLGVQQRWRHLHHLHFEGLVDGC